MSISLDPPPVPRHSATVLLVEDDRVLRDIIATVLSGLGFKVIGAETGAEALSKFQADEEIIDLLVTDLELPEIDGRQLARLVRATQPELKILFISGGSLGNAPTDSFTSFLAKPFSCRTLENQLRELMHVLPGAMIDQAIPRLSL